MQISVAHNAVKNFLERLANLKLDEQFPRLWVTLDGEAHEAYLLSREPLVFYVTLGTPTKIKLFRLTQVAGAKWEAVVITDPAERASSFPNHSPSHFAAVRAAVRGMPMDERTVAAYRRAVEEMLRSQG